MESIDTFSTFNKLSLISVVISSSLMLIASIVLTYNSSNSSQEFFFGLDTLIVTIFMVIFMIWEALKKSSFFEEPGSGLE